jgi:hypothetical protein
MTRSRYFALARPVLIQKERREIELSYRGATGNCRAGSGHAAMDRILVSAADNGTASILTVPRGAGDTAT